jgi:hypothetical protein
MQVKNINRMQSITTAERDFLNIITSVGEEVQYISVGASLGEPVTIHAYLSAVENKEVGSVLMNNVFDAFFSTKELAENNIVLKKQDIIKIGVKEYQVVDPFYYNRSNNLVDTVENSIIVSTVLRQKDSMQQGNRLSIGR